MDYKWSKTTNRIQTKQINVLARLLHCGKKLTGLHGALQCVTPTFPLMSLLPSFSPFLNNRFANKKVYVFLYGLIGCIFSATYAYFNGIITTLEKRYKIPSRNTGIISVGNDISQLLVSAVLSYYGSKGHRPRWMAFGKHSIIVTEHLFSI